ncbi:MAG TPA: hypothetical protein VIM55_14835 [Mucilaginibacter sp.]
MKYAFIIGSSAFIVRGHTISYGESGNWKPFLRIKTLAEPNGPNLDIDLDIKDTDGKPVTLFSNKPITGAPYNVMTTHDGVKVLRLDGSTIIHVHQLKDEDAMALEHNIVAELEVHSPVVAIRISGEFFVDRLHVRAENEKLFINENGYATSALAGSNDLKFTSEGVLL